MYQYEDIDEDRHPGWDGQPWFQITWMSARPEQPLALDEFLDIWADEPGVAEFVNGEPPIGEAKEFDVGCVSNLTVKRVA